MADQFKRRVSRILPGLTTEYTIVSMPGWAWYWLDTLVEEYFPEGYRAFIEDCMALSDSQRPLAEVLENYARLFREDFYQLTNDNCPAGEIAAASPPPPMPVYRFPQAVKLFGFLPFATTWDSVLARRGMGRVPTGSY